MEELIQRFLTDYSRGRDIDDMRPKYRPEKRVIGELVEGLMGLVYPGAWGSGNLAGGLERVREGLEGQIARSLGMDGKALCRTFLDGIPEVRAMAQTDVEAFYEGDPAAGSVEEIICCYPGLFAVTVYRLAHILCCLGVPMLPRVLTEHAHSLTGIDINPGAVVGKYFFIDHGTGIVIGETTVIGDHVKVYQGVTLGALTTRGGQSLRGKKRHPTIEDNVTIYAGASILGGNTVIGRDSVIGSNVFITGSIPPCTTVTVKNQELQMRPRECGGCPGAEAFWEKK